MGRPREGTIALAALALGLLGGGCGSSSTTGSAARGQSGSAALEQTASVAAAAANPVTVSPLPGTLDASPATQISFLGGPGTSVLEVRVVGSRSGLDRGVLRAYSTGTGESFLPAHPFLEGERVTVFARTDDARARGHLARSSFTVAYQAPIAQKRWPQAPGDSRAIQHY